MPKYKITPLFIPNEQGLLFAMYFSAASSKSSQCIIHIPAFAEEMNKSRHMVAMQAHAWAEQGISVLVLDLWGTGDSQGDFSEATWGSWLKNIGTAVAWMKDKQYTSINFWSLRSGALLALDYLQQYDSTIDRLICWQPVLNGEQFVMQFLRLRVASAMMGQNKSQEKTSDLKQQLLNGQGIEVAGYTLNPELVIPMMSIQAEQVFLTKVKQVHILELVDGGELNENYATSQWIKLLSSQEVQLSLDIIDACPFWITQEITESAELIKLSTQKVLEWA